VNPRRRRAPAVKAGEVQRDPEAIRAAYRYVVNGDAPRVVHTHGQPGCAMTTFELWQFLLDVPDGEQPLVAELVVDGGSTLRFEVRGAYATESVGEVVIELVER
jgi:hypothetical protein